jgi:hypothetical protein
VAKAKEHGSFRVLAGKPAEPGPAGPVKRGKGWRQAVERRWFSLSLLLTLTLSALPWIFYVSGYHASAEEHAEAPAREPPVISAREPHKRLSWPWRASPGKGKIRNRGISREG